MKFSGTFKGRIYNTKTGEITCWEKHNAITTAGFNWVVDLLASSTRPAPIGYIGFGTGTAATTVGMTTLQNEIYRAPVTHTWNAGTKELSFTGSIPVNTSINANITETGLFTEETGGVMFDRAFFSAKGVDPTTSFEFEFVITIME